MNQGIYPDDLTGLNQCIEYGIVLCASVILREEVVLASNHCWPLASLDQVIKTFG